MLVLSVAGHRGAPFLAQGLHLAELPPGTADEIARAGRDGHAAIIILRRRELVVLLRILRQRIKERRGKRPGRFRAGNGVVVLHVDERLRPILPAVSRERETLRRGWFQVVASVARA